MAVANGGKTVDLRFMVSPKALNLRVNRKTKKKALKPISFECFLYRAEKNKFFNLFSRFYRPLPEK